MPRIIVTTNTSSPPSDGSVLLDELVHSIHLSTGHAAAQLVERLAWAISDAEEAERSPFDGSSRPRKAAPGPAPRRGQRQALAA